MNRLSILGTAMLMLSTAAAAGGTVIHTETVDRLLRGNLDGIAVGSDGRLTLAPSARNLAPGEGLKGAARAWSLATTGDGSTYVGTGPGGTVYRIRPGRAPEQLAELPEPMVTALAVLDDGTVLAGTSPGGRIYRIDPAGSASLWVELGERYIWDLAVATDGRVFAATGENGILFEIDRRGTAEKLFQAQEPHLVRLTLHPQGDLLAGGGGRGMLYRIDPQGHGLVLYDDDLDQVSGIAIEKDGSVLAALMAAAGKGQEPAAVRFRIPGQLSQGAGGSRVEVLEEQAAAVIEGRIEGLTPPAGIPPARVTGRVIRILPNGHFRELWRSATERPFAMSADGADRVVFGTGSPARLYRCETAGATLLLALPEDMASAIVPLQGSLAVATSNPATPYALDWAHREPGVYLSPVLDAGVVSRWGAVRWSSSGLPGEVEFYTRTGNGPLPDRTWSAWSPARTFSGIGGDGSPDGRFLQWRLRIPGGATGASASGITLARHPGNRPPVLDSFGIAQDAPPAPGLSRFAWVAVDPDGDTPEVTVEYGAAGGGDWTTAPILATPGGGTWDTGGLPEGLYRIRARAGDHHDNSWRDGLWSRWEQGLTIPVDRTPPEVEISPGPDGLVLTATDRLSPVVRVQILAGGRLLYLGHPVDGVADSVTEIFLIPATDGGAALERTVRVTDGAGNVTEQPL